MPEVLSWRCRVRKSKNDWKTRVVQSLKALRPTTAASLKDVFLETLFRAYILKNISNQFTAWKLFKYGVFFGSYFPVFGLNRAIYGLLLECSAEAVVQSCSVKKMFLKICEINRKTPDWKRQPGTGAFLRICETFKSNSFIEQFILTASGSESRIISLHVSNLSRQHFLSKMKESNYIKVNF